MNRRQDVEWRPIEGFEGLYDVSSEGDIYSYHSGRELVRYINDRGYYTIKLAKEGKSYPFTVHRLVAKAFVEGYEEGLEVNHINLVKLDNSVGNLEWVTRQGNVQHMIDNGVLDVTTAQEVAKEKNKRKVAQYTLEGDLVAIYESQKEAGELTGSCRHKISLVVNGLRNQHNGFVWKRVHDIV